MKTKNLTETSRFTQVEAIAKNGEYEYQVSYSFSGKDLTRIQCNINKVETIEGQEQHSYAGYMVTENGNKAMNFPGDSEIAPHLTMFDSIVSEVKLAVLGE